jgi:very-short-patch-repair endonuclease
VKSITTNKKNKQLKVLGNKHNLHPLTNKNSPPSEGWIRPMGEDGVVKNKTTNKKQQIMKKILTEINGIPIYRNFVEDLPYNPQLKLLLNGKRKAGILSEVIFWKQVRAKTFHQLDFDRQRIIGNYIVDFYVKTLGLVIEIDGWSHNNKEIYDDVRQQYLESLGLTIFRITDFDVRNNLAVVMKDLENFLIKHYQY